MFVSEPANQFKPVDQDSGPDGIADKLVVQSYCNGGPVVCGRDDHTLTKHQTQYIGDRNLPATCISTNYTDLCQLIKLLYLFLHDYNWGNH